MPSRSKTPRPYVATCTEPNQISPKTGVYLISAKVVPDGRPELVECKGVDLEVPAANEAIVMERYTGTDMLDAEGPFGEPTATWTRATCARFSG